MDNYISVPNWEEFQHYKNRTPPWIKLHNQLLECYDFERLPDASKAHLLCIWLLASRTNNKMNPDPMWIGRKIGANSDVDIELLVKSGFLQLNQELHTSEHDASKVLHISEQSACLEREGEKRREEGELGDKPPARKRSVFLKPSLEEITGHIFEKGYSVNAEQFFNHYESNGWMVGKSKMKNWRAAISNWNSRNKTQAKDNSKTYQVGFNDD